jgi:hypothetical protein
MHQPRVVVDARMKLPAEAGGSSKKRVEGGSVAAFHSTLKSLLLRAEPLTEHL